MGSADREAAGNLLKVRVSSKYLGLSMMVGRHKKQAFAHYVDRFCKKVNS